MASIQFETASNEKGDKICPKKYLIKYKDNIDISQEEWYDREVSDLNVIPKPTILNCLGKFHLCLTKAMALF